MTEKEMEQYIIDVKDALGEICNYADGLSKVCAALLGEEPEETLIDMTLKRIVELGEQYI